MIHHFSDLRCLRCVEVFQKFLIWKMMNKKHYRQKLSELWEVEDILNAFSFL